MRRPFGFARSSATLIVVHSAFPCTPFKLHGFHATGAATAFAIRPRQRKATVTIEINVRIPLLDLRKVKSAAGAGIQENPSPSSAAKSVILPNNSAFALFDEFNDFGDLFCLR